MPGPSLPPLRPFLSQVSSLRMKKLATSVGCPAFINSHPQKDFRTEALWFFCGAVVQPLKSLNSEQFWCFSTAPCNSQVTAKTAVAAGPGTGLLPRGALPLAPPCGSAVLAGKAWLLPGLPGRQSGAKVSEPVACGLQWTLSTASHSHLAAVALACQGTSSVEQREALTENGAPLPGPRPPALSLAARRSTVAATLWL